MKTCGRFLSFALPWGCCTKKATPEGTTLYLHVFNWPKDGKLVVPGLKNAVDSATLLMTGAKLTATQAGEGLTLAVPETAPDAISATIVLKVKGTPQVEQE